MKRERRFRRRVCTGFTLIELLIIVAIIGAFLAGYFISPLLHIGTINDAITIPTMLVTLVGAVILLVIVRLIRPRR